MTDSLDEMIAWAGKHTQPEDLVLLGISHCAGTNCAQLTEDLITSKGIKYISDTECSKLKNMTVSDAFFASQLPGGGSILAVENCIDMNYDDTIGCSGYFSSAPAPASTGFLAEDPQSNSLEYTCYSNASTNAFPTNRMNEYLKKTVAKGPPTNGNLWQIQAIWQETTSSVTVGVQYGSSLLEDERRSGLNAMSKTWITSGEIDVSKANMWEINNVCNGGLELLEALRNQTTTIAI